MVNIVETHTRGLFDEGSDWLKLITSVTEKHLKVRFNMSRIVNRISANDSYSK